MTLSTQDIELLEMYLDRELSDVEAKALDERLAKEESLRVALERLRGHRSLRITAMSSSFDSDAASIERLVASVREAQADEAMAKASQALSLRRSPSPIRSVFAAAACVAFGLILGVAIQRQQVPEGQVGSPAMSSISSFGVSTGPLEAQGASVVSVVLADGRVMKVHFASPDHARRWVESVNKRSNPLQPLDVGSAKILEDEPY